MRSHKQLTCSCGEGWWGKGRICCAGGGARTGSCARAMAVEAERREGSYVGDATRNDLWDDQGKSRVAQPGGWFFADPAQGDARRGQGPLI